jgi:hypothetical protein
MVWAVVCRPKAHGGLGIHNLRLLNAALVMAAQSGSRSTLARFASAYFLWSSGHVLCIYYLRERQWQCGEILGELLDRWSHGIGARSDILQVVPPSIRC